ncbi:ABC transporter permease [Glycomyces harbinensis]|uniref:Osmoprotectant transport system permease protein n=1 Tax=Glycomyces harbinensis TaxID=58114 RepID=A0A1G7C2B0_9ACTN|nr:ABC transporter permease subunit [Glycomyces harbinensis]SDE32565.1 osmoprotectant transport system permease protein [Glycomyces harbinensis]
MSLFLDALSWLGDGANWTGPDGVPTRVLQHLAITAAVVGISAAVALPAGVLIGHSRRGAGVVGALTGAARAIPTLGLLTMLGLALGIGLLAPMLALVVLAIPSVLAGAYAGVQAVDPATTGAAKAIGMSSRQVVFRVELPLASPVIIGGLRAATLQVVATATLAAYTADFGLGRYLFTGLKSREYAEMLAGALLVAVLALLLELALATAQRQAAVRLAAPGRNPSQRTPDTREKEPA